MNLTPSNKKSARSTISVPGYGKLPIVVERSPSGKSVLDIKLQLPNRKVNRQLVRQNLNRKPIITLIAEDTNSRGETVKVDYKAIRNQKIILLTKEYVEDLNNKRTKVFYNQVELKNLIITKGDCPDSINANGESLFPVLLEWQENVGLKKRGSRSSGLVLVRDGQPIPINTSDDQSDNLVISPDDTITPPTPPHACGTSLNTVLDESDFKVLTEADIEHYRTLARSYEGPTVAIIDTGLKFNFRNPGESMPTDGPYHYRDAQENPQHFVLAFREADVANEGNLGNNHIGYCAVCRYKQDDFIAIATNNGESTTGAPLHQNDIRNSPYDDHRLLNRQSREPTILNGRHGTIIAAIIQQRARVPILPVKAFDNQGFGTLFDMLNAFNYVLQRQKADNIRVVNASWVTKRDSPLLRRKMEQLSQAGVFVVAAAGNIGQSNNPNLEQERLYPACYSEQYANVITVTTVARKHTTARGVRRIDSLGEAADPVLEQLNDRGRRSTILRQFGVTDVSAQFRLAGLVPMENYSDAFVRVGVVSDANGRFRNPFGGGNPLDGSSFACAYVSAFIAEQLRNQTTTQTGRPLTAEQQRDQMLNAMSGHDALLGTQGVAGGCYLIP